MLVLRSGGFGFAGEGFVKKHLEVGLVFKAALLGLLASHLDVGGIETDRGGGHCCAWTIDLA